MERVSFEIARQDVADALHAQAEAAGRSVEAELAALVEQTYAPTDAIAEESPIKRLFRLGRGLNFAPPPRQTFLVDEPEL